MNTSTYTEYMPLNANSSGGPRPPQLTKIISESLLDRGQQLSGFDWNYIETVGLPPENANMASLVPEEAVAWWASACGYSSLSEADDKVKRPQVLLLCRPAKKPPNFKKQLVDQKDYFLLRQALILARCIKSTYDPDKTPIFTARRLHRCWDLYTIGGFYAPEC